MNDSGERTKIGDPYSQESRAAKRARQIADRHPSLAATIDSVSRRITNLGSIDDPITLSHKLIQTLPLQDVFLFAEMLSLRKTSAPPLFVKLILPPIRSDRDMDTTTHDEPMKLTDFEGLLDKIEDQIIILELDALNGQIYLCSTEPKTQQKMLSALDSTNLTSRYDIRIPEISISATRLSEIFNTPHTENHKSLNQEINQNIPPQLMLGEGTITSPYTPGAALTGKYVYRLLFPFSKSLEQNRSVYLRIDGALLEMNASRGRVRYIEGLPRDGKINTADYVSFINRELASFLNHLDRKIPQKRTSSWLLFLQQMKRALTK